MRKFPKLGIYVVMFTDILKTFAQFFTVFALFITAFGLGFHMLLYESVSRMLFSIFRNFVRIYFWRLMANRVLMDSKSVK